MSGMSNEAEEHAERPDEQARRAYWRAQMEEAFAFMDGVKDVPYEDCGESLVSLRDAARDAGVEVAFSDTLLGNNRKRLFYMREGLIEKFAAVAREMNEREWVLKVEDGFRTIAMQTELGMQESVFPTIVRKIIWEEGGKIPSLDKIFRRLSVLVATSPRVGTHMSGSAMDISVLRRDDGAEVDRGGPYLELSELTPMASPFVSAEARQNRQEITAVMKRHGFVAYPWEFWHYSQGDTYDKYLTGSKQTARYGAVDFDPETGRTTPMANPERSLHSHDALAAAIEKALATIRKERG